MPNFDYRMSGFIVSTQLPLDGKTYCPSEAILKSLGTNSNLAFSYYQGMIVYVVNEKRRYEWREIDGMSIGLLPQSFTYPANIIVNGINYSNKTFNFFLKADSLELFNLDNTAIKVYKGYNADTLKHEFYTLSSLKSIDISYDIFESEETGKLLLEIKENLKNTTEAFGISVYQGFDNTEKKHSILPLISDNLNITISEIGGFEFLKINTPSSSSIPALYVNDLYLPTYNDWVQAGGNLITNPSFKYKGEGTVSKPFTDSINYTSETVFSKDLNTSIANALAAYVGTGTRKNPEKIGQEILIQHNFSTYNYPNDLNYNFLRIRIQGSVNFSFSDYIVNMDPDTNFDPLNSRWTMNLDGENSQSVITGKGFLNSGSTVSTFNYLQSKTISLIGTGSFYETASYSPNKYIFNADPLGTVNGTTGCNNDGSKCFVINCNVSSFYNGIYKIGGKSKLEVLKSLSSSLPGQTINPAIKVFHQTGGEVTFLSSTVTIFSERENVFSFQPLNGFTGSILFRNTRFGGYGETWFNKENNQNFIFDCSGSSTLYFAGIQLFGSTNLWPINFRNNIIEAINVDFTKVDFTQGNTISSINTIGANVIETLRSFPSRAAANADLSFSKNSKFLNTNGSNPDKSTWFVDIVIN